MQAKEEKRIGVYEAPLYKVKKRTGLNYVANFSLKTDAPPAKWRLRGVALLCSVN